MKSRKYTLLLLASMAFCGPVMADCTMPDDPAIPDGSAASGAEMLKAKKAVETYVSAAQDYMKCGVASTLQERMNTRMTRVVDKFNAELRSYKEKG